MNKKTLLILGVVAVMAMVIFVYGRPFYMPLVYKTIGKATVQERIHQIEEDAQARLANSLAKAGYATHLPKEIILVAFKEERILQVYAKSDSGIAFIKQYPFTAFSGVLGPKLREGDKQIPEGVYSVEYLNPNSAYYLSIKVNYPNAFDRLKTQLPSVAQMGGDIFIHGKALTIGCIPIGDQAIEEVFLLSQKAIHRPIKVIISPRDFRVNTHYPEIEEIDWEEELYKEIHKELNALPSVS